MSLYFNRNFNIDLSSSSRALQVRLGNRTSPYRHLHLLRGTLLLLRLLNALLPSLLIVEPPGWQCLPPHQGFPETCHYLQRHGAQKTPVIWQRAGLAWSVHPNLPTLLPLTSMADPWAAAPSAIGQIHTQTVVRWDSQSQREQLGVGVCQ